MKNRNEIPFGERLDHLLKSRGINWDEKKYKLKKPFAREMIEAGSFPTLVNDDLGKRADTIVKSITNQRCYESVTSVESTYLKAYCDFFSCSADYLFGYIDEVTHEKTDIAAATGLSESAIDSIKGLNHDQTEALADLLSSSNFKWALTRLANYKRTTPDYYGSVADFQEEVPNSIIKDLAAGEFSPEAAAKRTEADNRLHYNSILRDSIEYGIDTSFRAAITDMRKLYEEQA